MMMFIGGIYLVGAGTMFGLVWDGNWGHSLGCAIGWPICAIFWMWDRIDDAREAFGSDSRQKRPEEEE